MACSLFLHKNYGLQIQTILKNRLIAQAQKWDEKVILILKCF